MAIKINLLPLEERPERWPVDRIMTIVAAITVFVFIGIAGYNYYSIWSLENEIAQNEQQLSMLRPAQEKMTAISSRNQIITAKNNMLIKLTAERKPWYTIIAHLGVITPQQIWLAEVGTAEKNTIKIKGSALTYVDLSSFMQQLLTDALLAEPALVKAELDSNTAAVKFEMTVKIKGMQP